MRSDSIFLNDGTVIHKNAVKKLMGFDKEKRRDYLRFFGFTPRQQHKILSIIGYVGRQNN